MKIIIAALAVSLSFIPLSYAKRSPEAQTRLLWKTLNGTNLNINGELGKSILTRVQSGDLMGAAEIAVSSDQSSFVTSAVRKLVTPMAGREVNPAELPGDFVLTWMVAAVNDIPVRNLFLKDLRYALSDTEQYSQNVAETNEFLEFNVSDRQILQALSSQTLTNRKQPYITDSKSRVGVFSSLQYGQAIFLGGTNRRPLKKLAEDFLCVPSIENVINFTLPDYWVGRDIPRAPGGDPSLYLNKCMGCHAGMDAMRGAFAGYHFDNDTLVWSAAVQPKMNNDPDVFESGHLVVDHSWQNLGWLPLAPDSVGEYNVGLKPLMKMLVRSPQFYQCLVERTQKVLCPKKQVDETSVSQLAFQFQKNQKITDMFLNVTTQLCLKE